MGTIAQTMRKGLGVQVTVRRRVKVPASARDTKRHQLVSELLVQVLQKSVPEASDGRTAVIGITVDDMYPKNSGWRWAFAQRTGPTGVVSRDARDWLARMRERVGLARLSPALQEECSGGGPGRLRDEIRERDHPGNLVVPARGLRVVELDDVAARVVQVQLHLPAREDEHRVAVDISDQVPRLIRPTVGSGQIVDREREVPGVLPLPLVQVHLEVPGAKPGNRDAEGR